MYKNCFCKNIYTFNIVLKFYTTIYIILKILLPLYLLISHHMLFVLEVLHAI